MHMIIKVNNTEKVQKIKKGACILEFLRKTWFFFIKMYISVMSQKCRIDLESTETVRPINHQFIIIFFNLSLIYNYVLFENESNCG